jgi:hypothetical protein
MLESEQAQVIAGIKERHDAVDESEYGHVGVDAGDAAHDDCGSLLKIVDSQAQNNEKLLAANNVLAILVDELKADRKAQAVRLEKVESLYAIARTQVEEQAREIAVLKSFLPFGGL